MNLMVPIIENPHVKEEKHMNEKGNLSLVERIKDWSVKSAVFDTVTIAGQVVMTDALSDGFQNAADAIADTYDYYNHENVYQVGGIGPFFKKKVAMTPAEYAKTYGSKS